MVLPDQLGVPFGTQRANLPNFFAEVNFTGLECELKLQLAQFQVLDMNLHDSSCSRSPAGPVFPHSA